MNENIPSDEKLAEVSDLAEAQLELEARIAKGEALLAELKDKHKRLSEVLIPEAMMAAGLESIKLKNGASVTVSKYYSGKIPDDRWDEAYAWLKKTDNDSIVKNEVWLNFGKGEDQIASNAIKVLQTAGFQPLQAKSVHPMTLKAFIRDNIEAGNAEFPMDLFGAFIGNKTKIAPAKKA